MLDWALEHGFDKIATGHYARVVEENGRFLLKKSPDKKDQSYFLSGLTPYQLAHTLIPLTHMGKDEARALAEEYGLPVANKPDSQEICFIPDNDYASFIERETGGNVPGEGNFVTKDGIILGRHKGITHYTIGQRKGLNLAMGHPVFVTEIRPDTDEVVIGEAEDVFTSELICNKLNFMAIEDIKDTYRALVKIRYSHKGAMATLERIGEDEIRCVFDEPVRAVTPGQAVVFYEDGYILGGGTIVK
jgi:tRNA-specific 2-thiouridylase